jgi:hypothetical protein
LVNDGGVGYSTVPLITVAGPGIGVTALARAVTNGNNQVSAVRVVNPGIGYTLVPTVTVDPPSIITGIGTYLFNEIVVGSATSARGRVKSWDANTNKLEISVLNGSFARGEILVGTISSARYSINTHDQEDVYDKYSQNDEIEEAADLVVDFSESNPFGVY